MYVDALERDDAATLAPEHRASAALARSLAGGEGEDGQSAACATACALRPALECLAAAPLPLGPLVLNPPPLFHFLPAECCVVLGWVATTSVF